MKPDTCLTIIVSIHAPTRGATIVHGIRRLLLDVSIHAPTRGATGKEHVFASNYYPEAGEVVIVTAGGTKVRFKKGDKVEALEPVRVDGVIRKKMKPVTGAKKKK